MLPLLRLMIRLIGIVDLVLFTLLMLAAGMLPSIIAKALYSRLFHRWCRCFVRALGIELRVHQHYAGELPRIMVLIANHPSAFEDIAIPALFKARSLAKIEVADWWIVGRIARAAGTLFVDRNAADSRKAATQALIHALQQGDSIALYPEGGCKGRRLSARFFNGAFTASYATGIPIVPIYLHYEAAEDFEWGDQHLLHKIWQLGTASNPRANVHIHDPVDPADFEDAESLKTHLYECYLTWQDRYTGAPCQQLSKHQ
ncbi:1-acyl-sn-glycerol-3-phosphate acyltransferase [Burkholderiaceae bacterium DAT-1]|nr:1-acyl-sn-glycerol-3-phosphate acyltransferase [Burkholderiaceae bacterium DAT-1]